MMPAAEVPNGATDASETEPNEKKKLVPITRIQIDHSLQIRCGLNEDHVEYLRGLLKEHGHLDPVKLFYEKDYLADPLYLSAGFHRIEAYGREGRTEIPSILIQGTRSDALYAAMRENGRHGLMMSNADKRRAAELAVLDPVIGELTDAKIAKRIGCSASLVAEARRGETKEQASTKREERKAARQPKSQAEAGASPDPSPAPSTPSATGPALPPVNARERKPNDTRPTKAMVMRQIQQFVDSDVVDEQDILKLFESAIAEYVWLPKMGGKIKLRVVGKSGRLQMEIDVLVKDLTLETLILRNEGEPVAVSS